MPYLIVSYRATANPAAQGGPFCKVGDSDSDPELMAVIGAEKATEMDEKSGTGKVKGCFYSRGLPRVVLNQLELVGYTPVPMSMVSENGNQAMGGYSMMLCWTLHKPLGQTVSGFKFARQDTEWVELDDWR